jgi:hypothetical protein
MSGPPDFAGYARQLGLNQALYPALEVFRLLGVSKSYGWARLVATGELPVVRLPGGKLTMVKAVDIARFVHKREAETNQHPAKRVGRIEVKPPKGRVCRPFDGEDVATEEQQSVRLGLGGRP